MSAMKRETPVFIRESVTTGGYLKDIPLPHTRKFDSSGKGRTVTASVFNFDVGVHYWGKVSEEDNPIWNTAIDWYTRAQAGWTVAWDDDAGRGRVFEKRCNSYEGARTYCESILEKHFPGYTIQWKEGD